MKKDVDDVLRDALRLGIEDRARLAGKILASLNKEARLDRDGKWRDGMLTKISEGDPNAAKLIEWEEAKRRASRPKQRRLDKLDS